MVASSPMSQVSHCPNLYSVGQWDSSAGNRPPHGTDSGTVSLKALATNVLRLSQTGQSVGQSRDKAPQKCPIGPLGLGQAVPLSQVSGDTERTPLRARGGAAPIRPDASPLEALDWFERDPCGVVSWLARQREGQPRHLSPKWVAVIQAEARLRLQEVEE